MLLLRALQPLTRHRNGDAGFPGAGINNSDGHDGHDRLPHQHMLQLPMTDALSLSMMLSLIRPFVKRFQANRPKKEPPATKDVGEGSALRHRAAG